MPRMPAKTAGTTGPGTNRASAFAGSAEQAGPADHAVIATEDETELGYTSVEAVVQASLLPCPIVLSSSDSVAQAKDVEHDLSAFQRDVIDALPSNNSTLVSWVKFQVPIAKRFMGSMSKLEICVMCKTDEDAPRLSDAMHAALPTHVWTMERIGQAVSVCVEKPSDLLARGPSHVVQVREKYSLGRPANDMSPARVPSPNFSESKSLAKVVAQAKENEDL